MYLERKGERTRERETETEREREREREIVNVAHGLSLSSTVLILSSLMVMPKACVTVVTRICRTTDQRQDDCFF